MGNERLSLLMLMKIHRRLVAEMSLDNFVSKFELWHPRRIILGFLLYD